MTKLEGHVSYVRKFVGIPYIYGGNNPMTGFDCSGLMTFLGKRMGLCKYNEDLSAQMWFSRITNQGGEIRKRSIGSWIFYGRDAKHITHVAFFVQPDIIIEAGGGDETTKTVEDAKKRNACVREMPYNYREDVVAILYPNYGDE